MEHKVREYEKNCTSCNIVSFRSVVGAKLILQFKQHNTMTDIAKASAQPPFKMLK